MNDPDLIEGRIRCLENSIAVQRRVIERRETGRVSAMANDRNAGAAALAHDRRILDSSTHDLERLRADRRRRTTS